MRYLTLAVVLALGLWAGAARQNHVDKVASDKVIAFVGVAICGHLVGTVQVQGSGKLIPRTDMSPAEAVALAKTLPEENGGLVTIPCPQTEPLPPETTT